MPSYTNGKICYIEMPSIDVAKSAQFYLDAFGWKSRRRGDGAIAFDDTTGQVSGAWRTDRKPTTEVGLLIYIMVDDMTSALEKVIAAGGVIVQPVGADAPEITARFRDPAGNIFGLYQEPTLAKP